MGKLRAGSGGGSATGLLLTKPAALSAKSDGSDGSEAAPSSPGSGVRLVR